MKKESSDEGKRTYDSVRNRYEEWEEIRPPAPRRRHSTPPKREGGVVKMIGLAVGMGTALLLLLLAGWSLWVSTQWAGVAHNGAMVGYAVVTFFLLVAGVGGGIATWNHFFRVLDPNRAPAAHH